MEIRITGLEQVQRALKELPKELVIGTFAKALDRSAGVIAAELEARATALPDTDTDTPLSEHVITSVEVDAGGRGGVAHIGFDQTTDERTGKPQDKKALWVEFGHEMVTHDGKNIGHVPAHPFVRPAFDASAEKATEVFQEAMLENL